MPQVFGVLANGGLVHKTVRVFVSEVIFTVLIKVLGSDLKQLMANTKVLPPPPQKRGRGFIAGR